MGKLKREAAEIYVNRVLELQEKIECIEGGHDLGTVQECFMGTLSIVEGLYGRSGHHYAHLQNLREHCVENSKSLRNGKCREEDEVKWMKQYLAGTLKSIEAEIDQGLIGSIRAEISGGVIADLVLMAKSALEEEHKDVSAVLAAAALEDAMKRKALLLGIDVEAKDLNEIINALKAMSIFKGAEAKIVSSFPKLRNHAMHANWDKVERTEVGSLIGFLEQFLLAHFG